MGPSLTSRQKITPAHWNSSWSNTTLKGQFHQIRMTLKWGSFKCLSWDMRCLIFKTFWSLSLIYYRHFNFLSWGSKSVQIFHLVLNLIWGCSKWVQIALFASWNNSDLRCLFVIGCSISHIFYNHCSICVLKVAEVALYRFWTQIEDSSLLNLCSGPPTTFRTQIEQVWTHFEQPQIRFRTKWKIWSLFEPKH